MVALQGYATKHGTSLQYPSHSTQEAQPGAPNSTTSKRPQPRGPATRVPVRLQRPRCPSHASPAPVHQPLPSRPALMPREAPAFLGKRPAHARLEVQPMPEPQNNDIEILSEPRMAPKNSEKILCDSYGPDTPDYDSFWVERRSI